MSNNTVKLFSKTCSINEETFLNEIKLKRRSIILNDVRANDGTHHYVYIEMDMDSNGHIARQISTSCPISSTSFELCPQFSNVSFCGDVALEDVIPFAARFNQLLAERK